MNAMFFIQVAVSLIPIIIALLSFNNTIKKDAHERRREKELNMKEERQKRDLEIKERTKLDTEIILSLQALKEQNEGFVKSQIEVSLKVNQLEKDMQELNSEVATVRSDVNHVHDRLNDFQQK